MTVEPRFAANSHARLGCCAAPCWRSPHDAPQSSAAAIPPKPVKLVVPFPPGGPLDIVGRLIAQKLTEAWGQPVVVDNRPGAGGNIGADLVAKCAPDGYTILEGALSTHAVNVSLYAKMPYDPVKDFAPITLVAVTPNVLVVNPSLPVNSVKDLIAYAKANPGKLSFGSGSNGSAGHLAGELFKTEAGVDMVHIPYKGGAPALQALLAGDTQLMFDNLANSAAQIKAGKLKALAVTTAKRSKLAPELPTMAEAGLPGFDISTWFGLFAPAGTPKEIVAKWNAEVTRILNSPEMRERLAAGRRGCADNARAVRSVHRAARWRNTRASSRRRARKSIDRSLKEDEMVRIAGHRVRACSSHWQRFARSRLPMPNRRRIPRGRFGWSCRFPRAERPTSWRARSRKNSPTRGDSRWSSTTGPAPPATSAPTWSPRARPMATRC